MRDLGTALLGALAAVWGCGQVHHASACFTGAHRLDSGEQALPGSGLALKHWPALPGPKSPDLTGIYTLHNAAGQALALMRISNVRGSEFAVGIAEPTGNPGIDWKGHGTIHGKDGHYDWTFPDGKQGRTTIRIDADGNLVGQVRGAGIDWDYVGKRREGPVRLVDHGR
jgi:hypothetical protein